MGIYRGAGGTGDAVNDASSEATLVQELVNGATTQATNAATSATAAQAASTQAAISQGLAADSATAAASSASSASSSASTATTQATNAATSATAAQTAETAAELAETNAETAQAAAASSASAASSSASAAATSATNASNSATAAAGSASTASAAADAALTALDNFDDRYLGQKSTAPTLDNDGNALLAGALYFNTVSNSMKVYTGSVWVDAYADGATFLAKASNLSDLANAATARTNLGLGTIATQAASSVAITGGSINGTTIGATTASTGAFSTLSATGVTTVQAGTVSAPAITTTGDTNTGIYFPAADTIAFAEGGTEAMRITSNAQLSVNTANWPTSSIGNSAGRHIFGGSNPPLIVMWNESAAAANNSSQLYLGAKSGTSATSWAGGAILGAIVNNTDDSGYLAFSTTNSVGGNIERMRINSSGNVGVGTNAPDALLSVNGIASFGDGAASTPSIANFGDLNTGFWFPAADTIAASTNGSERIRLDSVGNLGLGATPSPWISSAKAIDIAGFSSIAQTSSGSLASSFNAYQNSAGNWIYKTTNAAAQYQTGVSGTAAHAWYTAPSGTAGNTITFTQAMTLNASGDVGIGTAGPTTKLEISAANAVLASAGIVQIGATTAGADVGGQITFRNSDARRAAIAGRQEGADATAGYLQFGTRGSSGDVTERMRINSAGNVGIGTSSPSTKLEVSGGAGYLARFNGDASNYLRVYAGSSYQILESNGVNQFGYLSTAFFVQTGAGTERMRIDSAGDVGIGCTPSAVGSYRVLELNNTTGGIVYLQAGGTRSMQLYGAATEGGLYQMRSAPLLFGTSNTERMRIDSSGNVGIGTTSPTGRLNVRSTYVSDTTTQQRFEDNTGSALSFGGTGGGVKWLNVADTGAPSTGYPLAFQTGGTERMRIDTSGNLLVGTTSSSPSSGVGVKTIPDGRVYSVSASSTNASENYGMYSTGAANYRFYVGWGGTIYATSTTITSLSDERVKENIADIDVGLDAVMALKPRKFDWKAGKGKDIKGDRGFIAQEFETVFPEMIDEWKDPAPEGEAPYKAVNADLIPVLVKAIQEQQAIIENLTTRLNALEGN